MKDIAFNSPKSQRTHDCTRGFDVHDIMGEKRNNNRAYEAPARRVFFKTFIKSTTYLHSI